MSPEIINVLNALFRLNVIGLVSNHVEEYLTTEYNLDSLDAKDALDDYKIEEKVLKMYKGDRVLGKSVIND